MEEKDPDVRRSMAEAILKCLVHLALTKGGADGRAHVNDSGGSGREPGNGGERLSNDKDGSS